MVCVIARRPFRHDVGDVYVKVIFGKPTKILSVYVLLPGKIFLCRVYHLLDIVNNLNDFSAFLCKDEFSCFSRC